MESVVLELARYLQITPEETLRRLQTYTPRLMADDWNRDRPDTAELVREFYRTTDKYLYELPGWNLTPEYRARIAPLLIYRNKKILEIGAGIGSLCIALALNGNDVTYYDINEHNRAFARQRFAERYLDIKIVDSLTGLRDYDLVVAIDTLEHIHKDDLPQLVRDIAGCLADGGIFYHRSNWGQQDVFPMHYDHSSLLDKLMADNKMFATTRGDYMKGTMTRGVQIGIPLSSDYVSDRLFKNMSLLETPPGSVLTTTKVRGIDHARNFIVKELKRDWLFFMDSDQSFPPGILKRLMSWNRDIVSGLVFKRTEEPVPMFYKYCWEEGKGHYYKPMVTEIGEYLMEHKDLIKDSAGPILLPPTFNGKTVLLEVDGVPGGCLLVNKRVFDAIKEPWFQCDEGTRAGEDFYFCRKAQEAGFKIYGDPGAICSHFAEEERDYRHFLSWAMPADFPFPWLDPGAKPRGWKGKPGEPLPPNVYPEQIIRKVV